jgi:hypothetical protein
MNHESFWAVLKQTILFSQQSSRADLMETVGRQAASAEAEDRSTTALGGERTTKPEYSQDLHLERMSLFM